MKLLQRCACAILFAAITAVGNAAPPAAAELTVTTLDGAAWNLAAARGDWVIVNFWATWCAPCIREMPAIDAFVRAHPRVRALGLAWQDLEPGEIAAFLRAHPVAYPIAIADPFRPAGTLPSPRALPTTYLIDPDGRIAQTFVGPVTRESLTRAIGAGAQRR